MAIQNEVRTLNVEVACEENGDFVARVPQDNGPTFIFIEKSWEALMRKIATKLRPSITEPVRCSFNLLVYPAD
jgi:hypothetical protein